MKKLRVVHLFNFHRGSRYPLLISEGLITNPRVDARFAMPVISYGKVLRQADPDLHKSLCDADLIFRCNDEHFGLIDVDEFLDSHSLWSRVVYYDFKDSCALDPHRLNSCQAYIKRSWTHGFNREKYISDKRVIPMDYGLLLDYFALPLGMQRNIDVAYLFPPDPRIGKRRFAVYEELNNQRMHLGNSIIGQCTTGAAQGRRAIFNSPDENPFLTYLSVLKRSRIVFTAYPDPHDGDSRTWEAFSSGALVFMDATSIPSPHPFIDGEHCCIYDARDRQSIREAIERARYYLNNEKERMECARRGFIHALTWHRPCQRIDYILDSIL